MTSRLPKKLSRAMLLCPLAAVALLIAFSSRLVRSSLAQESAAEPKTTMKVGVSRTEIADRYGKLPLSFEANEGQTDPQVKFLSHGPGYDLFPTATGAVLTLRKPPSPPIDKFKVPASGKDISSASVQQASVLRLKMIGANPRAHIEGREELPGKINLPDR